MNNVPNAAPFPFFGGTRNKDNDPIDPVLFAHGYLHIKRDTPWYRTVWNPTTSPYTEYLRKKYGKVIGPGHNKCSLTYTNIHGQLAKINPNYPFALIVYSPVKSERYYQTANQASLDIPNNAQVDWQVVNLVTGEIMFEPGSMDSQ